MAFFECTFIHVNVHSKNAIDERVYTDTSLTMRAISGMVPGLILKHIMSDKTLKEK